MYIYIYISIYRYMYIYLYLSIYLSIYIVFIHCLYIILFPRQFRLICRLKNCRYLDHVAVEKPKKPKAF